MTRIVAAVIVLVLSVGLSGCARSEDRPAGVTERWLQAISDQGRDGLRADAVDRARRYGTAGAARLVQPSAPEEDERYFSDLEVGRAVVAGDTARVPFRVTARRTDGGSDDVGGTAVLRRHGSTWRVSDVTRRAGAEKVPSEGGDRPARAKASHWLLAIGLGAAITAASVLIVEAQPPARPVQETNLQD